MQHMQGLLAELQMQMQLLSKLISMTYAYSKKYLTVNH